MSTETFERVVGHIAYRGRKITVWQTYNASTQQWDTEYGGFDESMFTTLDSMTALIDQEIEDKKRRKDRE